jgi:hypothetical protein
MSIVVCPSKEVTELMEALGIGPNCKEFKISFVLNTPVTITSTHYATKEQVGTLGEFARKFTIDVGSTFDVDKVLWREE